MMLLKMLNVTLYFYILFVILITFKIYYIISSLSLIYLSLLFLFVYYLPIVYKLRVKFNIYCVTYVLDLFLI